MPIVTGDLLLKYSTKSGSAGNTNVGSAANSLGRYISTTQITSGVLNNLFDDVTGDENEASDVEYRCFFIHNAHPSLTLISPVVWLTAQGAGGADIAISVDTTAASLLGSASAQAKDILNEGTAPAGQSFSAPTTKATGLSLGDIPAGRVKAIWVRRTANNTVAVNSDNATIRIEGDTNA